MHNDLIMKTFKKKQLQIPKRICLAIKQLRLQKEVSLLELSKRTKISKEYLQAIEECRFEDLGCAQIYQKNFIKKYVKALGENPKPYVKQFADEELETKQKTIHPTVECKKQYFSNLPQLIRVGMVAGIILVVSLWLGGQIRNTLEPPKLVILTPDEGYITNEPNVTIRGYTEPEIGIYINGENIVSDEYGNFAEVVTLNVGINAITIEAHKKHGKITEEMRHVIVKDSVVLR